MTDEAKYDLHTHSNISDGTKTPSEIAAEAKTIGLSGFALTDHDTVQGWEEARAAAASNSIEFMPGIELTTHERGKSIHLLAYGPSADDNELLFELEELRSSRTGRAQKMISKLSKDFKLDWETVLEASNETGVSVGRPHLADALVKAGFFAHRSEAFERVLEPSGPYYVPTAQLGTVEAIQLVTQAGGFPVLAHPAAVRMRTPIDEELIALLAESGLKGIEIQHPENREEWIPVLKKIADKYNLLATGASDYHGAGKPNRLGEQWSSKEVFETIREQVATPR